MSATPTFQFRIFTLNNQHQSSERFLVILVFVLSCGDILIVSVVNSQHINEVYNNNC